jgi:GntR family transcriptional regulator
MILRGNDRAVARSEQIPYLAVAAALRDRLDSGEFLPGEQAPSATDLAKEYKVSRTTAARAARVLADEGRLTVVRNWGTFVAENTTPRQR